MKINETRGGPESIGILALQHAGYSHRFDLDMRASVWAARVTDYLNREGAEEYGHWEIDGQTVGDLIGSFHWPRENGGYGGDVGGRPTGAWSWIFGAVHGDTGRSAGATPTGGTDSEPETTGPEQIAATTPPPGTYLGNGKWSPGTTVSLIRANSPIYGPGGRPIPVGAPGWSPTGQIDWGALINQTALAQGKIVQVAGAPNAVPVGFLGGGQGIQVGIGGQAWNPQWQGLGVQGIPFGIGPALQPQWQGLFGGAPKLKGGLFGIGGGLLQPQWQGLVAGAKWKKVNGQWVNVGGDLPSAPGGLFGIGLPNALPTWVFPDERQRPKKPTEKKAQQTAAWMSKMGDLDRGRVGPQPTDQVWPLRNETWEKDARFLGVQMQVPEGWPTFPRGHMGIVVAGTEEDRQTLQWHPTDPRLIAPHLFGDPTSGTVVAEPNKEGILDGSRQAHLQSFLRVVPTPRSGGKTGEDMISWVIGDAPRGFVAGGLVTGPGGHAHVGQEGGGFIDVGAGECPHVLGSDGDGTKVRSAHISTRALFRDPYAKEGRDASLEFSDEPYPDTYTGYIPVEVYLSYDPATPHDWLDGEQKGKWRWWTLLNDGETPEGRFPETPVPTPEEDPPPTITPPNDDPSLVGRQQVVMGAAAPDLYRSNLFSIKARSTPALLAQPTAIVRGQPDGRYNRIVGAGTLEAYRRFAPLTARLEAFGAQVIDDTLPRPWNYTVAPRRGRSYTGTAPGGFILLPPEYSLDDVLSDFDLDQTPSATLLLAGPGAALAAGTPYMPTGGVDTGATIAASGKDLRIQRYEDGAVSGDPLAVIDLLELVYVDGSDPGTSDLNDLASSTVQRQIGIRADAPDDHLAVNVGDAIRRIGFGACAGFAAIYATGGGSAQSVTAGAPVTCNQWTSDCPVERRATADSASNRIVLPNEAGLWEIQFSGHLDVGTASRTVTAKLQADGTDILMGIGEQTFETANSQKTVTFFGWLEADGGEEITLLLDVDSGTVNVELHHGALRAIQIG